MAGPHVLFSLNPSAGPTRQSHCFSSSSRNRRPTPAPVRRSAAATPAPPLRHSKRAAPALLQRRATRPLAGCSTRSAPAPPHAPSSSSPAPRPRLARSTPRCAALRHAAPPYAALRRPHRAPPPPTCSAAASQHLLTRVPLLLCPTRAAARALSHSLHPLIRRTQGARGIAS